MNRNPKYIHQTLAAVVIGCTACGQEPATGPDSVTPLQIPADQRAALARSVTEAVDLWIPVLEDRVVGAALREALGGVALQLGDGGQKAFDESLERARSVLARYDNGEIEPASGAALEEGGVGPDAPVLAMIRLTLTQVAAVANRQRTDSGAER